MTRVHELLAMVGYMGDEVPPSPTMTGSGPMPGQ
jgi:hypothetical protein